MTNYDFSDKLDYIYDLLCDLEIEYLKVIGIDVRSLDYDEDSIDKNDDFHKVYNNILNILYVLQNEISRRIDYTKSLYKK